MLDALARSIAETVADTLGARAAMAGVKVTDKHIGMHLWHVRGFRDHDTLVLLINHTREIIDRREVEEAVFRKLEMFRRRNNLSPPRAVLAHVPVQLAFDLVTA